MSNLCLLFQFCSLGRLSHEVGWKYQDVVATLEKKRKIKASVAYGKKQSLKVLFILSSLCSAHLLIVFLFCYRKSRPRLQRQLASGLQPNKRRSNHWDSSKMFYFLRVEYTNDDPRSLVSFENYFIAKFVVQFMRVINL